MIPVASIIFGGIATRCGNFAERESSAMGESGIKKAPEIACRSTARLVVLGREARRKAPQSMDPHRPLGSVVGSDVIGRGDIFDVGDDGR